MLENYAQNIVDELFEEGDRDFHFLNELLGFFENTYQGPFRKKRIDLSELREKQLEHALLLASFFIASRAYVGFYMEEYGKFDRTFDVPKDFCDFIKKSMASDASYYERINTVDIYTVGLAKIQSGAKAPLVTPEIKEIFEEL